MHINTTGTAQNGILCYGKEKGHQKGPETHWIRQFQNSKLLVPCCRDGWSTGSFAYSQNWPTKEWSCMKEEQYCMTFFVKICEV